MKFSGVLVTGSAGFIGSYLCEHFIRHKIPVVGLDNYSTGSHANTNYLKRLPGAEQYFHFLEADVTQSWDTWEHLLPTHITAHLSHTFHFASPASPPLYQKLALETLWANSVGLNYALQFSDRHSARLIYASTSEVYGDPEVSPQPESYWGHVNSFGLRSCYDESKRFGEALVYTHNLKKKTKHGLVRIFNTYGPRMNPADGRVIINFLMQAMNGEPLTVYGGGKQTRSFCYISDLLAAILAYAASDIVEPVNIGNDNEFSILELVKHIQEIFPDKKLSIQNEPMPSDDPRQRRPDLSKAKKSFAPWAPKITLKEGLIEMKDWLISDQKTQG